MLSWLLLLKEQPPVYGIGGSFGNLQMPGKALVLTPPDLLPAKCGFFLHQKRSKGIIFVRYYHSIDR
tara:strand:- start:1171 stop:1371 length:201 start_codon:yes stop_codon:yes gene_type:complete